MTATTRPQHRSRQAYTSWLADVARQLGQAPTWDRWFDLYSQGATPTEACHAWAAAGHPDMFDAILAGAGRTPARIGTPVVCHNTWAGV